MMGSGHTSAADANRVLDLVDQYLAIGAYDDALGLLERQYPPVQGSSREPGAVAPEESPLLAYYRGYVRERLGREPERLTSSSAVTLDNLCVSKPAVVVRGAECRH